MSEHIEEVKNALLLTNKIAMKGLVMTLWHEDLEVISRFKNLCYTELPKTTNWFHQCNSNEYQMFEFWIGKQKLDLVREHCQKIAEQIGMTLMESVDETKMHPG